MDLPPAIVAKIREAVADLDETIDWGRLGRQHDAIPLLLTIGFMSFLRSDGVLLEYEGDPLPERLLRESAAIDTMALAWGAERYPWLSALFPARPPDATDCAKCGGARRWGPNVRGHYIYCPACEARGWVPAG
jgi:hypothetical protein